MSWSPREHNGRSGESSSNENIKKVVKDVQSASNAPKSLYQSHSYRLRSSTNLPIIAAKKPKHHNATTPTQRKWEWRHVKTRGSRAREEKSVSGGFRVSSLGHSHQCRCREATTSWRARACHWGQNHAARDHCRRSAGRGRSRHRTHQFLLRILKRPCGSPARPQRTAPCPDPPSSSSCACWTGAAAAAAPAPLPCLAAAAPPACAWAAAAPRRIRRGRARADLVDLVDLVVVACPRSHLASAEAVVVAASCRAGPWAEAGSRGGESCSSSCPGSTLFACCCACALCRADGADPWVAWGPAAAAEVAFGLDLEDRDRDLVESLSSQASATCAS